MATKKVKSKKVVRKAPTQKMKVSSKKKAPAKKTSPVQKKTAQKKSVVTKKTQTQKAVQAQSKKTKSAQAKKAAPRKATVPVKKSRPAAKQAFAPKVVAKIDYSRAVTPLADRLVVRVKTGERITAGGLIIPDTASMATGYLKAEVLAVGSGIKTKKGQLLPLDVQIGDEVLFQEYAGTKVEFNNEELVIINESDVMGIVQS